MVKKNIPEVLIVHCVDTEGVMHENIDATFERIKDNYDIDLLPTQENLIKLREGINNKTYDSSLAKFISPVQTTFIKTLDSHRSMILDLSKNYRFKLLDSYGAGYIWNWHVLDFVGFKTNPRHRLFGNHVIFDLFLEYLNKSNNKHEIHDTIQWHYHHPPIDGSGHKSGLNWYYNNYYDYILSRKIIDRLWFPSVFRPGEHIERNSISFWLNQWIPFDYASRSIDPKYGYTQVDDDGRRHDWREASTEWGAYNPSFENYQIKGTMKRSIARILDINSRAYSICEFEIEKAFRQVKDTGMDTILAVMNHDIRDMRPEHDKFINLIELVKQSYPDIPFRYCSGVEAMRRFYKLPKKDPIEFHVEFNRSKKIVFIETNYKPFGEQPYYCMKTVNEEYFHEPLFKIGEKKWAYYINFNPQWVESIGLACNDDTGNTSVCKFLLHKNKTFSNSYNYS